MSRRSGPKPSITLEVVERVSQRVGMGMPLHMALETEGNRKVNPSTWQKALKAHPEFRPIYTACKGKFLDYAMRKLAESEELKHLCWLIERRHSDLFARPEPAPAVVNVSQSNTVVSLPDDVVQRAREIANAEVKLIN